MSFIGDFIRERKWARQRARRGFSDRDVWNLDYWFITTIVPMLEELKETKHGCPCDMTEEEYNKVLDRMIFCFRQANEDTCTEINQYDLEYNKQLWGEPRKSIEEYFEPIEESIGDSKEATLYRFKTNEVEPELKKKWLDREYEIDKYREDMKNEGFDLFKKYFWTLWD